MRMPICSAHFLNTHTKSHFIARYSGELTTFISFCRQEATLIEISRKMKLFYPNMAPKFKDITFNFIPVKTGLSLDKKDVKRRAINLYKAWYRQIPIIFYDYKIPITPEEGRSKLREIFVKNSRIEDPRVISTLILRGQMELNESVNKQKEECHLWKYFKTRDADRQQKPQDFLSKFLEGR